MRELSIEHILLFVVAAFLLYHLTNGCRGNGFRVGGQVTNKRVPGWEETRCTARHADPDCDYGWVRQDCNSVENAASESLSGWCEIAPVPRQIVGDGSCPKECELCECVNDTNHFTEPFNCNKKCFKL